jgi:hypothetical protein
MIIVVGGGTDWNSDGLFSIVFSDIVFNLYFDDDDISIFLIAISESVSGMTGGASFGLEVRLNG